MADSTVSSVTSLIAGQYNQPAITFTGLGSGIDSTSMIQKLVEAESGQIKQLTAWKDEWTAKIAALQTLNSKLSDLRTAAQAMKTLASFQAKNASVSNESVVTATASSSASSGTHQVLVNSLAKNEVEVHLGLAASDAVVNSSGASQVFAFSYAGGAPVSINVPDGTTLSGLADLINASGANPGVKATVLDMGEAYATDRYRLMLSGKDTGAPFTITIDDGLTTLNGSGGTANFTSTGFENPPPQQAQNAQVRLDGYPPAGWIERTSNTVGDLIPGVSLSLLQPAATPVQVAVTDDTNAMQEKITNLVNTYNDLLTYIQEQSKYDKATGKAGVLFGNYGLQIVKSQLSAIATGNAPGFADPQDHFLNLAQIGITTDADETSPTFGQLVMDQSALAAALSADPQAVANLMASYFVGASDDASGNITYYSSLPGITQPGIYSVTATVAGGVLTGGTINGHPAMVGGNTLTGASGYPEYGLAVQVNPTDGTHTGTVRLKLGLNGQFSEKLDDLLSASSGPVNILINNYQDIVGNIDEKIAFEQRRVDSYRQRLTQQFTRLEAVLSQLNDQSNYLASQIAKLGGSSSSNSG
uniref:Flagellar hook-associated protein 2 n=1 Tax=Desulfobacca acetoxidans TaxID=60893 RepID=A0A7C3UWU1_9BACT